MKEMKALFLLVCIIFVAGEAEEAPIIFNLWVVGNSLVSEEEILQAGEISEGVAYDPIALNSAMEKIFAMGYFRKKPEYVPFFGAEGVQIEVRVEEFPIITSIEFLDLISLPQERLLELMSLKTGTQFNSRKMEADVETMNKEFEKHGYLASQVVGSRIYQETGKLEIQIMETRVERIEVRGNEKTKQWVVTTMMDTKPGDVFNVGTIFEDIYRVYGMGIFDEPPKWKVEAGSQPDLLVLVIEVSEAKTGRLEFGAGYSEAAGFLFSISIYESNFRGKGQTVNISGATGARANQFTALYHNPLWKKQRQEMSIAAQRSVTLLNFHQPEGLSQYDSLETGGKISYRRPFGKRNRYHWTISLQSHRQELELREGAPIPPEQFERQGFATGQVNAISNYFTRNTRLDVIDPFNGSFVGFEYLTGVKWFNGDFSYHKFVLDLRRYWSLSKKNDWVFAVRLKGGTATGNAPVSDHFFLGGSETIRGYDWGWQRGTKMSMANVELRWRKMPIGAVLFYDIGTAAQKDQKLRVENHIASVGVGLRFKVRALGAFPIRLDFGYNLERKGTRGHFSFGQLF